MDHTRRTGFLHAGHLVKGGADSGRHRVNFPPHTTHFPSQSSYSYKGITVTRCLKFQSLGAKVKSKTRTGGGRPRKRRWRKLLDSASRRWGGPRSRVTDELHSGGRVKLSLPAKSVVVLARR